MDGYSDTSPVNRGDYSWVGEAIKSFAENGHITRAELVLLVRRQRDKLNEILEHDENYLALVPKGSQRY